MPCRAALPPPGSHCLRAAPLLLKGGGSGSLRGGEAVPEATISLEVHAIAHALAQLRLRLVRVGVGGKKVRVGVGGLGLAHPPLLPGMPQ